jgi:hypothetical protein
MREFKKDPDAELDYGVDWGKNYLDDNETIASSTWEIVTDNSESGDLEILTNPSPTISDGLAKVWVTGGIERKTHKIRNRIETDKNRKDDRTFRIRITER